ncbi:single-stranded DNA-binding protein [Neisseria sp.]
MPYLNRIEVMGNLGKDPELRYLSNQTPVTTISLAYKSVSRYQV